MCFERSRKIVLFSEILAGVAGPVFNVPDCIDVGFDEAGHSKNGWRRFNSPGLEGNRKRLCRRYWCGDGGTGLPYTFNMAYVVLFGHDLTLTGSKAAKAICLLN